MSSSSSKKIITLTSSDGETFQVEESVISQSQTIKYMIEDDCANTPIPLSNITSNVLSKVIAFCKKQVPADDLNNNNQSVDDINDSSNSTTSNVDEFATADMATLFDLILAANYLNIKTLLDLTCQAVADKIKDKTVEEVREIFNVDNDFTPEEEKVIRKENEWAFN